MNARLNLVAVAFTLTALSYGLARFAYGLLLPQIREALSLSATAAGWIGGAAFAAYCVGIIVAGLAGGRLSPRTLATLAGAAGTAGMAIIAGASAGWTLGVGVGLAGLSTGLTSPPLASAVSQQFDGEDRPKANGAINAGTSAGIVLSGLAALMVAGAWRELYVLFALTGGVVTAWVWLTMPANRADEQRERFSFRAMARPGLRALCLSAFLMGAASTAVWTFGADILRSRLGFSDGAVAAGWIVLGSAGLAGLGAGVLTARFGVGRVHRMALLALAVAILSFAAADSAPPAAFAAMAVFGAAYIISSGALLIQGVALLPDRPDLGLGVPFLAIAAGQTAGAPLFGMVSEQVGSSTAVMISAALACGAMAWPSAATDG